MLKSYKEIIGEITKDKNCNNLILCNNIAEGSRQDSMGLQCIVYFPYVEIDGEKKEEILDKLTF